jgi:hypothetical protein
MTSEAEEWESEDDETCESSYRRECKKNLLNLLKTRLNFSDDEAKEFMTKVEINVPDALYVDCDEVRHVTCKTTLPGTQGNVQIVFRYHHRPRMYGMEHDATLHVRLNNFKKYKIFNNTVMDIDDGSRHQPVIEIRKFSLRKNDLRLIQKALIDPNRLDGVTLFDTLLLVYTACSIPFRGIIHGPADCIALKHGWLEYYSRTLAGCPTEQDNGYTTDDPQQELEDYLKNREEYESECI